MRNIKLTLAYDGTDFQGWQIQKEGRTVQGEVEKALSRMHKREMKVHCAGRTDSGVHATGQVINFFSDLADLPPTRFAPALSSFLPQDIAAVQAEEASEKFHARYWARERRYVYYILVSPIRLPHCRRYSWRITNRPDIARLNRLAAALLGEHDFTTFSTANEQVPNRRRQVLAASFYPQGNYIVFCITAVSFLWKMVRSIVGSLIEYEQKGYTDKDMHHFLLAADRSLAGVTMPARGLFLDRVVYGLGDIRED